MEIGENEICEVVGSIWESVLNRGIEHTPPCVFAAGQPGLRTAFIQIAGEWKGAVVCVTTEEMIRQAAGAMFGMKPDELTVEFLHDALGELANMIGGNLKALLPGPSVLCLPAVVEGLDYSVCIPSAKLVIESSFLSDGQPMTVKLLTSAVSKA